MRHTNRAVTILSVSFIAGALCLLAGLPRFYSQTTSPQIIKNDDGTTTVIRTGPLGGTTETTQDEHETVTKVVYKDKAGKLRWVKDFTPQAGGGFREDTIIYFEGGEKPEQVSTNIEYPDGSTSYEIVEYDLKDNIVSRRKWGYKKGADGKGKNYEFDFNSNQWKELSYLSNPGPTLTPTSDPGYATATVASTGTDAIQFTTPQGKVTANVTDDLQVGDTISGTVKEEPTGKNEQERTQNRSQLSNYVLVIGQQATSVGQKTFTRQIPPTLSTAERTISLVLNGKTVASSELPISPVTFPAPPIVTLPTGGQQGRLLEITEPCNGKFDPADSVKIGGSTVEEVAESPRKKVVRNTSETLGPSEIVDSENGHVTQAPFRNLTIHLSAPNLHLLKGQTTILTTTVLGLKGITYDVPMTLVNNSDTVIAMSGGNAQSMMIPHAEVSTDGTYSTPRTLTGIRAGGFGITGTVTWKETYTTLISNPTTEVATTPATTPVYTTTTGTTLTHPDTDATTTVDPKTGETKVKDPKTGTTVTVDPKKKTTTVTDDKTGKSTSAPHNQNGSSGGKDGEPKVDVNVTENPNNDGTTTTTAVITITGSNGQTTTVTVTSTTDTNGGQTTQVTDPADPNSSTSTTVDNHGEVTKTAPPPRIPMGPKRKPPPTPKPASPRSPAPMGVTRSYPTQTEARLASTGPSLTAPVARITSPRVPPSLPTQAAPPIRSRSITPRPRLRIPHSRRPPQQLRGKIRPRLQHPRHRARPRIQPNPPPAFHLLPPPRCQRPLHRLLGKIRRRRQHPRHRGRPRIQPNPPPALHPLPPRRHRRFQTRRRIRRPSSRARIPLEVE